MPFGYGYSYGGVQLVGPRPIHELSPTLFLDAADATALRTSRTGSGSVADAGVVGMVLDKSQLGGLSLDEFLAAAPEILANGTFDSDVSSWAMVLGSGSVTWASGAASVAQAAAYRGVYQVISGVVPGEFYRLTFTLSNVSFASTGLQGNMRTGSDGLNGDATTFFSAGVTTPGIYRFIVRSTITAGSLAFRTPDTSDTYTLDNISLKHLPGYHAVAQSDAARPVRNAANEWLDYDLVDDALQITIPTGGWTGNKVLRVTDLGAEITTPTLSAGTYTVTPNAGTNASDKLKLFCVFPSSTADSLILAAAAKWIP